MARLRGLRQGPRESRHGRPRRRGQAGQEGRGPGERQQKRHLAPGHPQAHKQGTDLARGRARCGPSRGDGRGEPGRSGCDRSRWWGRGTRRTARCEGRAGRARRQGRSRRERPCASSQGRRWLGSKTTHRRLGRDKPAPNMVASPRAETRSCTQQLGRSTSCMPTAAGRSGAGMARSPGARRRWARARGSRRGLPSRRPQGVQAERRAERAAEGAPAAGRAQGPRS